MHFETLSFIIQPEQVILISHPSFLKRSPREGNVAVAVVPLFVVPNVKDTNRYCGSTVGGISDPICASR